MKNNLFPLAVFIYFFTTSVSAQDQGFFLNQWTPENITSPPYTDVKQTTDSVTTSLKILFNDTITKIPCYVFGDNANLWTGFMSDHPRLMKYMSDRRMGVLRGPGGGISDVFFWNRNPEQRPSDIPTSQPGQPTIPFEPWYGVRIWGENWTMAVDSFYSVLNQTAATGMITVNYGYARYGTGPDPVATAAHLAADWVRYDKGRTKFWEIGNEVFGDWEAGYRIDKSLNKDGQPEFINGTLYGQHCLVFIDSMRKAAAELGLDIKIGLVIVPEAGAWFPSWATWNKDVASIAGDKADFYVVHSYYTPYLENTDIEPILNSYKYTGNYKSYIWSEVDKVSKPHLPVALTEYNISAIGSNQPVSHINGMHAVLVTGEAIKKGYGAALRWDLANGWDNGNDHGMFSYNGEPGVEIYSPRPAFYHLYFQRRFTGDVMLKSTMRGDTNNVVVFPTAFSSGQAGITIVNKGRDNEIVRLNIQDFKFGNRYYTYTLTGEPNQDFSRKVFINGVGNSLVAGGPENYENIEANSSLIDKEIKIKVPPLSSTFILVEPGDKELEINEDISVKPTVIKAIQKILFDESHNERNTISEERAQILNPEHPGWVSFSNLKSKLNSDLVMESYRSGTISDSLLKNYDVLVLSAPNDNFSSLEVNSIVSFVNNGGGLCFLGDAGLNPNINSILQNFGIQFENHSVLKPVVPGQDLGNSRVQNFISHASIDVQSQFLMNWGGSFNISPPAIALGFTDNLTWRDLDWNMDHSTDEPSGPFAVFSAAVYGKGKVFCISDNAIHNDIIQWEPNDKLFINAVKWLTAPPTTPNLLSPLNTGYGVLTYTKLEWASVESTNYYRIQVSKSPNFDTILIDRLVDNYSLKINNLNSGCAYFWRVNATNSHGESKWSEVWSFTTQAYNFTANTGNNADISIPVSATFQSIQIGDEIGVFTPQGLCVGSATWENNDLVITVWGDNDQSPNIDGIKAGEQFSYRIWRKATGLEQNIDCLTYSQGDGKYTPNGISIISSIIIPVTPSITQNGDKLHSDALTGNQWYNKDGAIVGATTQDFSPKSNGDYYVVVSVNGCTSNPSNSVNFILTEINPIASTKTIKVYPNPTTNELTIEFEGNSRKIEFEILNSISQVVFTGILVEKTMVQTTAFKPGIYLIRLKSGDLFEFKKVLKN